MDYGLTGDPDQTVRWKIDQVLACLTGRGDLSSVEVARDGCKQPLKSSIPCKSLPGNACRLFIIMK